MTVYWNIGDVGCFYWYTGWA